MLLAYVFIAIWFPRELLPLTWLHKTGSLWRLYGRNHNSICEQRPEDQAHIFSGCFALPCHILALALDQFGCCSLLYCVASKSVLPLSGIHVALFNPILVFSSCHPHLSFEQLCLRCLGHISQFCLLNEKIFARKTSSFQVQN